METLSQGQAIQSTQLVGCDMVRLQGTELQKLFWGLGLRMLGRTLEKLGWASLNKAAWLHRKIFPLSRNVAGRQHLLVTSWCLKRVWQTRGSAKSCENCGPQALTKTYTSCSQADTSPTFAKLKNSKLCTTLTSTEWAVKLIPWTWTADSLISAASAATLSAGWWSAGHPPAWHYQKEM